MGHPGLFQLGLCHLWHGSSWHAFHVVCHSSQNITLIYCQYKRFQHLATSLLLLIFVQIYNMKLNCKIKVAVGNLIVIHSFTGLSIQLVVGKNIFFLRWQKIKPWCTNYIDCWDRSVILFKHTIVISCSKIKRLSNESFKHLPNFGANVTKMATDILTVKRTESLTSISRALWLVTGSADLDIISDMLNK